MLFVLCLLAFSSFQFGQSGLTLQSEKSYNITLDPKRNSALRKAVIDYGVAVKLFISLKYQY